MTFVNNTVTGNSATGASNGSGGGISQEGSAAMLLSNTTVTRSTADTHGGGIYSAGGTVTLQNSIVADNPGPAGSPDCAGPAATDVVGKSAKLAALADNGGPTLTHALLADSPAKDAGNPAPPGSGGTACEATDQRGFARPGFAACDIGAFEVVTTTTTLPPAGCTHEATFASIDCRLDVLIATVDAAQNLKQLQAGLSKNLKKARSQKKDAEAASNHGKRKPAKSKLKKAVRTMTSAGFRLRSLTARKIIQGTPARTDPLNDATAIRQDMQTLLKKL